MTWRGRRKFWISAALITVFLIFAAITIGPSFKKASTCFDGTQNGDEKGIDCGGSCPNFCSFESRDLLVRWKMALPVSGDVYNATAYIENPNPLSAAPKISYEFKFYDRSNIFITSREGSTFVGFGPSAIVEPLVDMNGQVPVRAAFQILSSVQFYRVDPRVEKIVVSVRDKNLTGNDVMPKLTATLTNESKYTVRDLEVVALIYDNNDNAIASSKTFFDSLPGGESTTAVFTWPKPFPSDAVRTEIITRINPFQVKI